eukprot:2833391-Pleurochrysis_carterae.AAC.2
MVACSDDDGDDAWAMHAVARVGLLVRRCRAQGVSRWAERRSERWKSANARRCPVRGCASWCGVRASRMHWRFAGFKLPPQHTGRVQRSDPANSRMRPQCARRCPVFDVVCRKIKLTCE